MNTLNRFCLGVVFLVQLSFGGFAQSGIITTVAGNGTTGFSGDGGSATSAQLSDIFGVAIDSAGNLYVADQGNFRIRKVTVAGVISTVAGNGTMGFSGDGGPATAAQLNAAGGVAVDLAGNLYIADEANFRIRKVDAAGVISTVAGNGTQGSSGDGGPATAAQITPYRLTVDSSGNLYIVDIGRIRKVTTAGVISTVAGNGTEGFSGDGGPATAAQLNSPNDVAIDAAGNLYIADGFNRRIRKVTPAGVISTVAGNGTKGFSGDGGPATAAQLYHPMGVAVDSVGNLYIADDSGQRIRKVTAAGIISTLAGDGTSGFTGDGGSATAAQLSYPMDVAVDSAGNVYISDNNNVRIRKVTATNSSSIFFPQMAVGGGYTTEFTLVNTGDASVDGNLILTAANGTPLNVSLTEQAASPIVASSLPISIPPGGTQLISASAINPGDPVSVGWARVESSGGKLDGVSAFRLIQGSALQSVVGVLSTEMLSAVTVPINNDSAQERFTGYAIANTGSSSITVRFVVVGTDGNPSGIAIPDLTLSTGEQRARFFSQDAAALGTFQGSVVLIGENNAQFVVVALVQDRGTSGVLFTAIPVIPSKASNIN